MTSWSLALIACLCGMGTMAIYRRTTDLERAGRIVKRLVAHLTEMRLYSNEPSLIWRAQLAAIRESARLFVAMAKPSLLVALPMAWLLIQLHSTYGLAPLPLGEPAIVTAHFARPMDAADQAATLVAPPEIAVETPPVRVIARSEISWRVRPLSDVRGFLVLKLHDNELTKSVQAGSHAAWLAPRRAQSLLAFLIHPQESRLPSGEVDWIDVSYLDSPVRLGDLEMPWLACFTIFATLGALLAAPLRGKRRRPVSPTFPRR
jgi:hypothetical protein